MSIEDSYSQPWIVVYLLYWYKRQIMVDFFLLSFSFSFCRGRGWLEVVEPLESLIGKVKVKEIYDPVVC